MAQNNPNWLFWKNFTFTDAFAYVSLFLSIRGGQWHLRLVSIKNLAPLFAAFDRPHYRKLIPQHLDVLTMPQKVIECLEQGAFVCSITGT